MRIHISRLVALPIIAAVLVAGLLLATSNPRDQPTGSRRVKGAARLRDTHGDGPQRLALDTQRPGPRRLLPAALRHRGRLQRAQQRRRALQRGSAERGQEEHNVHGQHAVPVHRPGLGLQRHRRAGQHQDAQAGGWRRPGKQLPHLLGGWAEGRRQLRRLLRRQLGLTKGHGLQRRSSQSAQCRGSGPAPPTKAPAVWTWANPQPYGTGSTRPPPYAVIDTRDSDYPPRNEIDFSAAPTSYNKHLYGISPLFKIRSTTGPKPVITGPTDTVRGPFDVTITFPDDYTVSGMTQNDIVVSGGTLSNFRHTAGVGTPTGDRADETGDVYTVTVSPRATPHPSTSPRR